jgi:hypothetical protein
MTKPVTRESRAQGCTWLFGRGASIASGLPWVVPSAWKDDLASGRVARDAHVQMVIDAIRDGISKLPTEGTPYRRLLDMMATRTVDQGHHRLMTTNWDYLLQRDLTNWVEANWPGWAPGFLALTDRFTTSMVRRNPATSRTAVRSCWKLTAPVSVEQLTRLTKPFNTYSGRIWSLLLECRLSAKPTEDC